MIKKDLNTKNQILKTTGKLFSMRGYFGVSMQDIADELGMTKAALYYHFDSKGALAEILLEEAVKELKQELKQAVADTVLPSSILFKLIKTFLDFKIKHPEISLLTTLGPSSDERIPILAVVIDLRQNLIKFVRELIGGIDFTRKLTYQTIFAITTLIISFTLSPFYHQRRKDSRQAAQDLSDLICQKI